MVAEVRHENVPEEQRSLWNILTGKRWLVTSRAVEFPLCLPHVGIMMNADVVMRMDSHGGY